MLLASGFAREGAAHTPPERSLVHYTLLRWATAVARALETEEDPSVRRSFVFILEYRTHQDLGDNSGSWVAWLEETER